MQCVQVKTCSRCKEEKMVDAFRKHDRGLYGVHSICKSCENIRAKEYQAKNKKAVLAKKKEYREKSQEKIQEYMGFYRKKNKTQLSQKTKEYRVKNAVLLREKARNFAKQNLLQRRASENLRRARKMSSIGQYNAADVEKIHLLQRYKCACCGVDTKSKYHVDHITSLARGGSNNPLNLQILCPTCNMQKSAKHPIDFMQEKGFLL